MVDIPEILAEKFATTAENRGDDPDEALERLMLEYIRQNSTISELFAKADRPVTSIDEYDCNDDRPIGYSAAAALPSYGGQIEIDPEDVTDEELPQYADVKRELILGVLRYRQQHVHDTDDGRYHQTVVRHDDVVAAAEAVLGDINSPYKEDEYVERVMDEMMLRNPGDESTAFLSPSHVMEYLEAVDLGNLKLENDVYYLTKELVEYHKDEIDLKKLNTVRSRFSFEPLE
ncbi:hypothetical protein [Haloferax denitrificans]|uniref:hypothetical protein n=1 Tax=Haloferax denitrificans TaxID=35745 RepID=UPI003C6F2404